MRGFRQILLSEAAPHEHEPFCGWDYVRQRKTRELNLVSGDVGYRRQIGQAHMLKSTLNSEFM